jgi:predicted nuclease of predicted toxin-antitoxin system
VADNDVPALHIRLYIDEHVWRKLAAELRERGFDAVNVYDAGRAGLSDEEQWEYAVIQKRALLTFDKDGGRFIAMASEWFYAGRPHCGLIVSAQLERGELLRRVLRLLDAVSADEMMDTVRFLEEFK